MIEEFNKFVGNKILGWFLSHPTDSVNINELAREIKISTGSVKKFVDLFYNENIIEMKKIATAHIFTLNNSNYVVRELKNFYDIETVESEFTRSSSRCNFSCGLWEYGSGKF